MSFKTSLLAALTLAGVSAFGPGFAQTAAADPSAGVQTCVGNAVTAEDRKLVVRYVFFMMATHPDVAAYANIPADQRTALDTQMGAMMTRIMAEQCAPQIRAALSAGGQAGVEAAFGKAFEGIGAKGMQDLMTQPEVQAASMAFTKHMDMGKVIQALSAQ